MRKFVRAMCHPGTRSVIGSIMVLLLTIALVACGDDSGTSANDGDGGSEAAMTSSSCSSSPSKKVESSSSQKSASSSSIKKESSSSVKAVVSSSSVKTTSSSSVAPASSSSKKVESSSSQKITSSSSATKAASSSSVKAAVSSSSVKVVSSSSVSASSSSKKVESSSSQKISSSSLNNDVSSGIEYKPYAHDTCLAGNWNIHKDVYKQFTDPRNGRSYYYYTATSHKTGKKVTVMAENLNIGDMVPGENDQNDDTKIERYCYDNDTTNCDKYGGLYQWAEMMQLPSSCNTESCYKKIERKHQGICPDGWRLFTWNDFEIVKDYYDKYGEGIPLGLRSQCFSGHNTSGFSLIGAGRRAIDGSFVGLNESTYWVYPQEHEYGVAEYAYAAYVLSGINDNTGTAQNRRAEKIGGYIVRCTKLE